MPPGVLSHGPRGENTHDKLPERAKHSNIYAVPGAEEIKVLPWAGCDKYKVGEVLCDLNWKDGTPVEESPRYVAKKQLQTLEAMGYSLLSAFECEFSLVKNEKSLFETSQYFSMLKFNEAEKYMFDLEKALCQCGVDVECLHVESGPGQMELSFRPTCHIKAADNMFLFKRAAKEIAKKHGIEACFMAKPFEIDSNTAHFNHSLWSIDTQRNVFYTPDEHDKISELGKHWIGGIIKHIDAITAFCCPTVNCYRCLHDTFNADRNDWDYDSREVSIRVKHYSEEATYIENRIPTSAACCHLVMAATLAAGIDGIKNKIEPPPSGKREDSIPLPSDLHEALDALESDHVLVEALGEKLVESFLCAKRNVELAKFGKNTLNLWLPTEVEAEKKEYFELI